jgi:hypothetical protein
VLGGGIAGYGHVWTQLRPLHRSHREPFDL